MTTISKILHKKSNVANKKPESTQLEYGEIAINYHKGSEMISIKNDANEIVSFNTGGGSVDGSVDTSNFVTLHGDQTIDGEKTFNEYARFKNGVQTEWITLGPEARISGNSSNDIFIGNNQPRGFEGLIVNVVPDANDGYCTKIEAVGNNKKLWIDGNICKDLVFQDDITGHATRITYSGITFDADGQTSNITCGDDADGSVLFLNAYSTNIKGNLEINGALNGKSGMVTINDDIEFVGGNDGYKSYIKRTRIGEDLNDYDISYNTRVYDALDINGVRLSGDIGQSGPYVSCISAKKQLDLYSQYINLYACDNTVNSGGSAKYCTSIQLTQDKIYCTYQPTVTSDETLKDIEREVILSAEEIANTRSVAYKWKDRENGITYVGSIAQDWQKILPESVSEDENGKLGLSYGSANMVATISLAKEVVDLKEKVARLEKIIEQLTK